MLTITTDERCEKNYKVKIIDNNKNKKMQSIIQPKPNLSMLLLTLPVLSNL